MKLQESQNVRDIIKNLIALGKKIYITNLLKLIHNIPFLLRLTATLTKSVAVVEDVVCGAVNKQL